MKALSHVYSSLYTTTALVKTRKKIWETFLDQLEKFDDIEDADLANLRDNLAKLSGYVLNGRANRRQLAMFKGKSLNFECMKEAIIV